MIRFVLFVLAGAKVLIFIICSVILLIKLCRLVWLWPGVRFVFANANAKAKVIHYLCNPKKEEVCPERDANSP